MTITDFAGELDLAATLAQLAQQVSAAQTQLTSTSGSTDREPVDGLVGAEPIVGDQAVAEAICTALSASHQDAVWIAPTAHLLPLDAIRGGHLPLRVLVQGTELAESSCGLPMRSAAVIPGREVLVIDSMTLLLPYRSDSGEPRLIVARQPRTAMLLQAVFESLWNGAVPTHRVGAVLHALDSSPRREIVRLLAGGATDEMIARRLGISKRTCSRHVAHILACSGASSRFQAGIMLARSGLDIPA